MMMVWVHAVAINPTISLHRHQSFPFVFFGLAHMWPSSKNSSGPCPACSLAQVWFFVWTTSGPPFTTRPTPDWLTPGGKLYMGHISLTHIARIQNVLSGIFHRKAFDTRHFKVFFTNQCKMRVLHFWRQHLKDRHREQTAVGDIHRYAYSL